MVQGETNTAVSPSIQTATTPNNARLYENINGINMNTNDGEKKKKVGNYIISKTIGEGSFAKVRLGYHLITQQMVAVKVINKREVLKRNYLRANLRREACMMQRMQHPHIIQLYEVMETENCYYIVMELIDGIEFVKYLSKKRSLDENETREYIRQICSAVDHMHKAKVVHRDIKLQNFMLDQNHNLTIIDFGLSNSLDEREFLNTQCGSPAYAAPEIFAHQDYGPEVDIWSIGVNMYAMLAGKLPFKVENRSKNLAKLHACILKGFELPPFLSPDCQDLLCRLLEPSPNKRIKMSEIFAHPWLNFNSFPVELIPYKPVVDSKEIKPEIVQYLVQKHDYSENDVIDAIVYRKPIALKAIYYLIEKRLKQGLSFPDPDYNNLIDNPTKSNHKHVNNENNNNSNNNNNMLTNSNANSNSNSNHHNHHHHHNNHNHLNNNSNSNHHTTNIATLQTPNLSSNNVILQTNGSSGLTKQNSQLLPKRHNVQVAARSSSQKNVDFKSIFNNMNLNNGNRITYNTNNNRDSDSLNNHNIDSNSPSPDFIAAAMSPIKTTSAHHNNNAQLASASSLRTSRQTNYQDLVNRKQNGSNSSINNIINNSNNNINNINARDSKYETQSRVSATSYAGSQNDYKIDRYYVPNTINNRMSPADEPYQPIIYFQPTDNRTNLSSTLSNHNTNINNTNNNTNNINNNSNTTNKNGTNGSIRSLPSSIYRGSPERSLPRSPDRQHDYINNNNLNNNANNPNYRPTTSRVSSRPSISDGSEKSYDVSNNQKYKVANYLSAKRSLTSCDEPALDARQKTNGNLSSNIVKNRQLHMGKAKIDLDTQPNLNVGVSIKSIGNYLKPSSTINSNNNNNNSNNNVKTSADNLKTFNSLNVKPNSGYKLASSSPSNSNHTLNADTITKVRQTSNLVHRHSNPVTSFSTPANLPGTGITNSAKTRTLQPTSIQESAAAANALPRIRINS